MDQAPKSHELGQYGDSCNANPPAIASHEPTCRCREGKPAFSVLLLTIPMGHGLTAEPTDAPGSCMVQGSRHKLALRILAFLNERVHSVILHSAAALLSRAVGITE